MSTRPHKLTLARAQQLHQKAMVLVELATVKRVRGKWSPESPQFRRTLKAAYELEKQAAEHYADGPEPTRSVLFRSAAALAQQCGLFEEAEMLLGESV